MTIFFSFYKMLIGNRKKFHSISCVPQMLCNYGVNKSVFFFFFFFFDGKLEKSVFFSVFIVKLLKKSDTYNFYFILC